MGRVAVVGGFGIGMTMRVSTVPEAGSTVFGSGFALGAGGKGSNQAVAARRLGAEAALLTAIGPDDFGRLGTELWRHENVDARAVKAVDAPTMVGVIFVEPNGENRIVVAPGALAELAAEDVEPFASTIADADVLVVSLEIPVAVAEAALRIAARSATTTILNPSPPPTDPALLRLADITVVNQAEAAALGSASLDDSPAVVLNRLRRTTGGTLVLTLGADGVLVDDGSTGPTRIPSVQVPSVVDTTGAGDAFLGALAASLADGFGLHDALGVAVAAGAFAVTVAEVIPALPSRADLRTVGFDALVQGGAQ